MGYIQTGSKFTHISWSYLYLHWMDSKWSCYYNYRVIKNISRLKRRQLNSRFSMNENIAIKILYNIKYPLEKNCFKSDFVFFFPETLMLWICTYCISTHWLPNSKSYWFINTHVNPDSKKRPRRKGWKKTRHI